MMCARAWMRALRAIGSTLRRIRIGMSEVRGTKLEARYASELDATTVATGDTGQVGESSGVCENFK